MLAEKVRAIFARGKPRDLYDLWFFLKRDSADPNLINKKLRLCKMKFDAEKLTRCIEAMSRRWEVDLKDLVIGSLPSFKEVKTDVVESLTSKLPRFG
jgi:predicted nucleotidyltransferase component of viral defense system